MRKITLQIDEWTNQRARQLAAEKGLGFREYLAKMLKIGLKKYAKKIDMGKQCMVTLEIDDDTNDMLKRYSGCFYNDCAAAKYFVLSEVGREWGDRV